MSYQELVKKGLLKKEKIGFDQLNKLIKRTFRTLKSAKILLENDDVEGSFRFAYETMLLTGRVLVFSFGFRPRTVGSHKIVVDFAEGILGDQFKILVQKFDKMRRKRNYLIYGIGLTISKTEAENAVKTAEKFIEKIEKYIETKNPQQKLWRPGCDPSAVGKTKGKN